MLIVRVSRYNYALNNTYTTPPPDAATGENITELLVSEGWLAVRRESIRGESNLVVLEDQAKAAGKVGLLAMPFDGGPYFNP